MRSNGVLLSNREREIMDLLSHGLTGEQVAARLVLSTETVKTHIRNAMSKLSANTRAHAVAIALRDGHIEGPLRVAASPIAEMPADPRPAWVATRGSARI